MVSQNHAIALKNVQFSYENTAEKNIINIPDWRVSNGDTVFLYGPSGTGKSTLLNLLTGILTPQNGEILLKETAIHQLSSRHRDRFRAQHIGVVFQQFNLIPYLTVKENILLASDIAGTPKSIALQRLTGALAELNLKAELVDRKASQLSVGQQQRVAIIRALINHPDIVIVDEPTSALDHDARIGFINMLLAQIRRTQCTLIFVSHDQTLAPYFNQQIKLSAINIIGGAQHVG